MKTQVCPNTQYRGGHYPSPKIVRHGYFSVRCGRRRRFRCLVCGRTFSNRLNSAYFRLRYSAVTFNRVVLMSVEGISRAAIARVERVSWHTADRWISRASEYACRFNDKALREVALIELQAAVMGTPRQLEKTLAESDDSAQANTSFIERLNLTLRRCSAYLARRSTAQAHHENKLKKHLELVRCYYNFIRRHQGLRFGREVRTPAMVAGLTDRVLPFSDVFRPALINS